MGNKRFMTSAGIATVFLMVVLAAGVAFATAIDVDTFDAGSTFNPLNGHYTYAFDGFSPAATEFDDLGILGGERDVIAYWISGGDVVEVKIDARNSNYLNFATGPNTLGRAEIIWDGNDNDSGLVLDTVGLSNFDLTDLGTNDGFQLLVEFTDGDFDLIITAYNGASVSSYTLALTTDVAYPGVSFFIPFADFSPAFDFSQVGALVFSIEPQEPAVDLTIDLFEAEARRDYGDLPAAYNLTLHADGGAYHLVGDTWLGTTVDVEPDGVESLTALGDDTADFDDEDGIVLADTDTGDNSGWMDGADGGGVHAAVHASGSACLSGWIDWNADGDFGDAGEHILDGHGVDPGTSLVTFDVPAGFFGAPGLRTVNARFRLYPETTGECGAMAAGGAATNGEVEDYQWNFDQPTAVTLSSVSVSADSNSALIVAIAALGVLGVGLAAAVVLGQRRKARLL